VEDAERLAQLLQTKYAARLEDERGRQAVFQALLRKGFSYADVRAAMKDCVEETGDDIEENNQENCGEDPA